ncbi:hyaluronan-mediated motility receptor [Biomphalaria glabrata]|nr:hyaluronan-mediated motility receptor [Biomphalaria glabrata]
MGHQNHRQKVKYVETLKKIAPVIATAQCDSSKMTQTPGEPRIPFKGKKMLSESECMCPVCISLLIQPVTFPCNHSVFKMLQGNSGKSQPFMSILQEAHFSLGQKSCQGK